jgi:hypothetical protein
MPVKFDSLLGKLRSKEAASAVPFNNIYTGLSATNVQAAIDETNDKVDNIVNPLVFKGSITVAADFPTLAQVATGWFYSILANVTDNDPLKTNTGASFLLGDEIAWNGSAWTVVGSRTLSAANITYDDAVTGLPATNAQDAIDSSFTTLSGEIDTLQTYVNEKPNYFAGVSQAITVSYTPGNSGQITVTQAKAFLHKTPGWDDEIVEYTLAQITPTLVANTYTYIIADYNSGSPIMRTTTNPADINSSNVVLMGHAQWEYYTTPYACDEVHYFIITENAFGHANKITNRLINTMRYERSSGLALSEKGTRNVYCDTGVIWYGNNNFTLGILDTSVADKIHFYYHVGGVWTVNPNITQYNNTQYDNGTNLVSTSANKYVVNWIYRSVNHADFFMVLGGGDYKLNEAEASQPPALPTIISRQSILVGRIIVLQGASTATVVQSTFQTTFTMSAVQQHNDLALRDAASAHPATAIDYSNGTSGLAAATVQAAIDELDGRLDPIVDPMLYKGAIATAAGFPTSAAVKTGWFYTITANVTDNDGSKTNTGLAFLLGDEIVWNGSTWVKVGPTTLAASAITYDPTTSKLSATTAQAALDEIASKVFWVVTQNSHGFALYDVIYNNAGTWTKARADAPNTLGVAVVSRVVDANNFCCRSTGMITKSSHGYTVGQYLYLSAVTAGLLTATEPVGLTYYSNPLAYVLDANTIMVSNWRAANSIPRSNDNYCATISSTPYNVTDLDEVLLVDTTSATITVNLPTPSATYNGFTIVIKKVVAANTLTIKSASGNIDGTAGSTGIDLTTIYDAVKLICCGTNWWKI